MLDFLRKELVDQLYWSNIGCDTTTEKRVLINGREHFLEGNKPYAVAAILVWKVPVLSSKQFKYAVSIGVAQQKQTVPFPHAELSDVLEAAVEKAWTEPTMTLTIDDVKDVECSLMNEIVPSLVEALTDDKMVLTEDEVIAYIKRACPDKYTQKYPLDFFHFGLVKPAL